MADVICVEGLNKKYEYFELSDVSFKVPEGCVAGFIGLNGQGKTTTIRSMLGLAKIDSGKVEIFGKDFKDYASEIKNQIGIVFDEGYLYDSLKMKEMKSIIAEAYTNWDEKVYQGLLKRFHLNENQSILNLSKGMRMKFALSLALSHHAKLLIMDEPTSGLDPLIRKELLDILQEYMSQEGVGVLYSTHITSDLDRFADIIVFIHEGEIVLVEEKDKLLDQHKIAKGDSKYLTEENKKLFIKLDVTDYGFQGVTREIEMIKRSIPDLVLERVNIEDLMIAYIQGGKKYA